MFEKIGRNLGKVFLIILGIALFIGGYQCGSNRNTLKTDSKTIIDTFTVKTTDTIKPPAEIKWYALKPKIRVDTFYKFPALDSIDCNRIQVYEDTVRTKDYDLYRKSYVQGKLRFDTTGVKLKVPLVINNETKTTIRRDSLIYRSCKYKISAGIIASPKMLAPTLELGVDRWTYMAGYDPFNKQPIIGIKYKLISWGKKKK